MADALGTPTVQLGAGRGRLPFLQSPRLSSGTPESGYASRRSNWVDSPTIQVINTPPRKIRKFRGDERDYEVEEFIERVEQVLEDEKDQLRFLLDHVEGPARRELKTCGVSCSTVRDVFSILRSAFGDSRSLPTVTRLFMERVQGQSESVREFATEIFELFTDVQRKQQEMGRTVLQAEALCDQFVDGLRDRGLVWELKGLSRSEEDFDFSKLRIRALEWESIHGVFSKRRADSKVVAAGDSEVRQLKLQVEELQRKLRDSLKAVPNQNAGDAPAGGRSSVKFQWTKEGAPICTHCGKAGHIRRFCRQANGTSEVLEPLNGNPSV